MELRLLAYVVAIAEAGTVSGAARALGLTQPTLSRQLRDLEHRLDTPLFEREGRALVPTPAGAALVDRARRVLTEAESLFDDVRLAAQGRSGTLTVTFAGSGINGPLGPTLARLRRELPRVSLRLVESFNDEEMSQGVLDGTFDIAVQRLPAPDRRLAARPWWREPLTLFLPQAHPLAQGPRPLPAAPPEALGRIPLVLWPRAVSPPSYDEIIALCHRAGVVPRIEAEGRSVQTVLALVAAGFGAGVLADSMRVLRRVGVVARPIEGTTTVQHVVCRAGDDNPLVTRFLDVARPRD
ncbi:LysR family transcriptional regulator [Yinghuangia seranimata]|uniref:LysR family transcriptional regulator n=1 Tax=Yinghuangia seranimata TaxID=408067 RepID=UPI00248C8DFA|nr:LysR family transcriptional regulator [Yinghuangia seranimata]MDI2127708.1 LysR substrate-binding domain-containing protein [Yinghuangia seranimata]